MTRVEYAIQVEVAALLDALRLPWLHVPNERHCSPALGARLKAQGVKAGVPDIIICRAHRVGPADGSHNIVLPPNRHGLAIELKAPGNYPTPEQRAWLERLEAEGWTTAVCRSLSQVVDVLHDCDLLRHPESGKPLDIDNARHGFITEARS